MNKSIYFTQNIVSLETKGRTVSFRYNWEALFQESIGSLGVFFTFFHKNMQAHDKRLFCYLICVKTATNPELIIPLVSVIQSCDEYTFRLLQMLMPTPLPKLTPLPIPAAKPTPYVGSVKMTPAMGSVATKPNAVTILPPTMPVKTTYPDAFYPIEDSGLDENDDTLNLNKLG